MDDAERIARLEARVDALAKIVGQLTIDNKGLNRGEDTKGPTEFQQRVWDEVERIPFGEARSYGEIHRAFDPKGSGQMVGGALDTALVHGKRLPWWRVIRNDGTIATPPSYMQDELLAAEGYPADD